MGAFGRKRMENELEWRHEAPKLIPACETLWRAAGVSTPARRIKVR